MSYEAHIAPHYYHQQYVAGVHLYPWGEKQLKQNFLSRKQRPISSTK